MKKQKSRPSHSDQTKYIRGEQARAIAALSLLCISLHQKQQQQCKQRPNRFLLLFRFNASTILLVETVIKSRRSIISACHNIYGLFFSFFFPPLRSLSACAAQVCLAAAIALFSHCFEQTMQQQQQQQQRARALALLLAHSSQCPPPHY